MHFFCPVLIEKFHRFPHLCASYNAVIYKQQFFAFNQIMHRNQLHFCNFIPHGLAGWHKASRPSWRILNKRSCKRNAAAVCIADGVRNAGIRHTAHIIDIGQFSVFDIRFRHDFPVSGTHHFDVDPFIARIRIAVICPQECTDFHFVCSFLQNLIAILCELEDFACL